MTQTYYTPTVLTVATGIPLSGLTSAFQLMHDLLGSPATPENLPVVQSQLRAEIVRQHPWIAELRLPEDPCDRRGWLAKVMAAHGAALDLAVDTRVSA